MVSVALPVSQRYVSLGFRTLFMKLRTNKRFGTSLSLDEELVGRYTLVVDKESYARFLGVSMMQLLQGGLNTLKNGLRSWLKLVISLGATNEKTVQVATVPLNNFQVTPLTLRICR